MNLFLRFLIGLGGFALIAGGWIAIFLTALGIFSGTATPVLAERMSKEEFIDTYSKMISCVEADADLGKDAWPILKDRAKYYVKTNFTQAEMDQLTIILRIRAKEAVVTAKSCEAVFKALVALPLPPQ